MTRRARLVPAALAACSQCDTAWGRAAYLWHDDTTDTLLCGHCAGTITTGASGDVLLTPALTVMVDRCRLCRRSWPALCAKHSRLAGNA